MMTDTPNPDRCTPEEWRAYCDRRDAESRERFRREDARRFEEWRLSEGRPVSADERSRPAWRVLFVENREYVVPESRLSGDGSQ